MLMPTCLITYPNDVRAIFLFQVLRAEFVVILKSTTGKKRNTVIVMPVDLHPKI